MIKFFKENFHTTNDCIILATPMILFFVFTHWYIETFQYSLSSAFLYSIFFITLWIWISGCCSGWFYMVKKTLQFSKKTFLYDLNRISALKKLFLCLFKGIGKYFLQFLVIVALYFIIKMSKIAAMFYLYTIVDPKTYNIIGFSSLLIIFFISYWVIFLVPEITYNYISPFKALINSAKKSYISYKSSAPIYIILCIIGIILNAILLNTIMYPFLYFIVLITFYYFVLYSILAVFKLYEKIFIE